MAVELTADLERFMVRLGKKRTTVSMDGVLCQLLRNKFGNMEMTDAWVKLQADNIHENDEEQELLVNMGLSRMIQQKAMLILVDELLVNGNVSKNISGIEFDGDKAVN